MPKSLTISPPKRFTHGFCHWVVKSQDHSERSRYVSLLRLPGVISRERDRAESHAKSLAQTVDELIISPTPASSPASSELHRPQPFTQPPVKFSKQEKLKVNPPHKKSLRILTLYNYFKHVPLM